MKALSRLMYRSFVVAALCCASTLFAQEYTVTASNQDLFAEKDKGYGIRVRLHQYNAEEPILKIKVWKITAAPPNLTLVDATADVVITAKDGTTVITEIKVKNGVEDFKIKPLTTVAGQNLLIQLYNNDANKPVGYMVLAVKPTGAQAEKDIKTVSTPIGVGRH